MTQRLIAKKLYFLDLLNETVCKKFLYLDQDFRLGFECALNSPQLDATKRHHPASILVAPRPYDKFTEKC